MPDSKITALTSISTSTDPANDPLVIVDVSDTSMAATGTTKKVTLNQLLGAGGTATLASATITGDLTVDTSTLKVDSANNRVGINKSTPAVDLDVGGSARFQSTGSNWMEFGINVLTSNQATGASIRSVVSSAGNPTYSWTGDSDTGLFNDSANSIGFAIGGSEGMRLNSTGLGVGVSPSYKLDASATNNLLRLTSANGNDCNIVLTQSGVGNWMLYNAATNGQLRFQFGGNDRMIVDTSGNVGIGVTPSAKFDVGLTGAGTPRIRFTSASDDPILEFQRYSGVASDYYGERILTGGGFFFQTAPAAAVGSQTFTTRMSLDASGRLILLASTTTPATLSTNGQLTMTATSDTNLRFSYRGSDGVTRVANLTLA